MDSRLFKNVISIQLDRIRKGRKLRRHYSAEAVHGLRVAALRAIFALKFFKPHKAPGRIRKVRRKLKGLRRILGRARNIDLLAGKLKKYIADGKFSASQSRDMEKWIRSNRAAARAALKPLLGAELDGTIKGLNFIKQMRPKSDPIHKLRIAFKNLRYACEFLADLDKKRTKRFLKSIVKQQNILGNRQDAISCLEILSENHTKWAKKISRMEGKKAKRYERKL